MSTYDKRSVLHIEHIKEETPYKCFHVSTYRVTSMHKISQETFDYLRKAGFFGSGQSWRVGPLQTKKMQYVPEGTDWRGLPFQEVTMPYCEYTVINECDSGD